MTGAQAERPLPQSVPVHDWKADARAVMREVADYAEARWRLVDAVKSAPDGDTLRGASIQAMREECLRRQTLLDAALARAGGQVP